MSVQAQPVMRYMEATARALDQPQIYIDGVMGAPRVIEDEAPEDAAAEPAGQAPQ
jgi:multicomponent K+:H+ antiporter subunit D